MNNSIYHFFCHLIKNRRHFFTSEQLDEFPFPDKMLSCRNKGVWPDLAIRLNKDMRLFTGGDLIELKDSKNFSVSSFNSTIPMGTKDITTLIAGKSSIIRSQMEEAGNNILTLRIRDVYYLVRGIRDQNVKVCLVHGKFFETISESDLIGGAFKQMLEERLLETGVNVPNDMKERIISIFNKHNTFAQSRKVNKASVKLRFRIMTEVMPEGNILIYPEIEENSLNLLIPYTETSVREHIVFLMDKALSEIKPNTIRESIRVIDIQHRLNGPFICFQTYLSE